MYGIIYCAENEDTHKLYIGQTIFTLEERANQHLKDSLKKNGTNGRFANSIYKHGPLKFKWRVLDATAEDKIELDALEEHYICNYKTYLEENGYNRTRGGGGTQLFGELNGMWKNPLNKEANGMYGKKHTEETRKKMSESQKGNKNCVGRIYSQETKDKIRKSNTGKTASEETRKKMSAAHKNRPREIEAQLQSRPGIINGSARSIEVIKPNGEIEYYSYMGACKLIPYHQIKFCVKGFRDNFKGFKCRYLTEEEIKNVIFIDIIKEEQACQYKN